MVEEKFTILNETTLECLNECDELSIVKKFMNSGIRVLGADFGFVWLNSAVSTELELVYKSPGVTFTPHSPRKGGRNYTAIKSRKPNFVVETKKTLDAHYVSRHIKSFVIIPLVYKEAVYGSMVFCFKSPESFPLEKKILSSFIGNSVAQTITINRLIVSERDARISSEAKKAHYRALIEHSYEIITHVDKNGTVLYVSPSVKKILGLEIFEVLGRKINEFTYDSEGKKINYFQKILRNQNLNSVVEFCYKDKKDGSLLFLESTSSAMPGEVKGIVMNIRDVTERKKLEQAKETKRQLEEEQFKIQSIADATHELRTPVAIIKGNVDLVLQSKHKSLRGPLDALKAIDVEVEHLSGILSDLSLITSKKQETKKRLISNKIQIKELVTKVSARFKSFASKKNISIAISKIPEVNITGDRVYLEMMLANLIKNSIIYGNQNGHTKITVKKLKDEVVMRVIDDGLGIAKEDLPHIFERFYRADKSHSSDGNSTGLGLSIVKWVVEAHGGEVVAKKMPKKGTLFEVKLPLKKI